MSKHAAVCLAGSQRVRGFNKKQELDRQGKVSCESGSGQMPGTESVQGVQLLQGFGALEILLRCNRAISSCKISITHKSPTCEHTSPNRLFNFTSLAVSQPWLHSIMKTEDPLFLICLAYSAFPVPHSVCLPPKKTTTHAEPGSV
eukprot:1156355-Pelagomonas_calceolata.AAC.7